MVLIYILLMANEVKHLFTLIYHLYIIFSAISVLVFFAHFLLVLFLLRFDSFFVFLIQVLCQICGVQLFSPNL